MSDFLDPSAPQTQQFGSLIDDLVQKTIEASPIDALVADHMVEQKQKTTQAIASSIETNPDEYARYMRLSQKSGLDPEMLRTDPNLTKQVEQDQKLGSIDIATMQRMSPATAKFMSEPYNAAVAHDDISNLSFIEMVLDTAGHNIKEAAKLPRSIAGGLVDFVSGMTGVAALEAGQWTEEGSTAGYGGKMDMAADLALSSVTPFGPVFGTLGRIIRKKLVAGNFDQSAKSAETWLLDKQKDLNKTADIVSGTTGDESFGYASVLSGARSFGMMSPTLLMSIAARNPTLLLGSMAATTGGLTYGEAKDKGLSTGQATRYAVEDGFVEYFTELWPTKYLFSDGIFKQSLAKAFINFGIKEGLTEQAATAWQDLNKWVNLEPDKPLIDYIKARPSAALQTAIATAVASGLQVSIVKIGNNLVNTKATDESKDFFDALAAGVAGSKLQTRLPEKMQEFIAAAKETGGIKEVFIDAGAYQKYFQDNNLSPEVAATELLGNEGAKQLNEAAARGGDFVIPIEVFAAKVAGSPHYGGLVNDLRLRQGDASVNDIAAYEAEAKQQAPAAEQIQQAQAAENEVVNKLYDSTYQEAVAGGIPVASAEAWASIQAESYRTRATRLGVDAAELYKQENQEVVSKQETQNSDNAELRTEEDALNGLKFSKAAVPKVLYRGVSSENNGAGVGSLGKGIYTSTSKKFAAKFGEVKEISLEEAYPKNPLILPTNQGTAQDTFTDWVLQNSDFKNIREFNKTYPDPGKFVQEQGYDGIIAGDEIVKYSKAASDNTLAIVHNLSLDNLLHADKMGGIAAPSLAVTDKNHPLEGFGEITLIGDKNSLGPQVSTKNRYFNADVYSPRYPNVKYVVSDKDFSNFTKSLSDNAKKLNAQVNRLSKSDIEDRGVVQGLEYDLVMQYEFLQSQGKAPAFKYKPKTKLPAAYNKFIDKASDYFFSREEAFRKVAVAEFNKTHDEVIDVNDDKAYNIARNAGDLVKRAYDEKIRGPQIDTYDLDKKVRGKVNSQAYKKWLADNYLGLVSDEKIFNGFSYSGNKKYLPHNLDTVVKILTKEVRGGEGFNYGVPSIRAHVAKQFKTIKSIQDARSDLVTKEQMEALKEEVNAEFNDLENELEPYHKYERSQASEALAGLASKGYREFKEYYTDVPTETMQKVVEFLDKLKHMPSEYFEAKIGRAVGINEFSGALVPAGKDYDAAVDLLKKHGITNIKRFKDQAGRAKALQSFTDLLFSQSQQSIKGLSNEEVYSKLSSDAKKLANAGTLLVRNNIGELSAEELRGGEVLYHNAWQGTPSRFDIPVDKNNRKDGNYQGTPSREQLNQQPVQPVKDRRVPDYSKNIMGAEGLYNPSTDTLYLFSDNINDDNFNSVVSHELFHRALAVNPKLKAATERFDADFQARFDDAAKGVGSDIELAAYKRVITAKTPLADQQEEFKAYIVTEYQKNPKSLHAKLIKVIKDWIAAIKIALVKYGMDFKLVSKLTPADLLAMSRYGSRIIAENEVSAINTLAMASKQGYEGTDAGEAFEWLRAKAKGLDMSQEARMARAKTMGFDISKVWYHGTDSKEDFKEFDAGKSSEGAAFGKGIYLTESSEDAGAWIKNKTNGRIIPTFVKYGNILKAKEMDAETRAKVSKFLGREVPEGPVPTFSLERRGNGSVSEGARLLGYAGIEHFGPSRTPTRNIVINDPSAIRSINAAFDPYFADSGNLLASAKAERFYSALNRSFLENKIPKGAFDSGNNLKQWLSNTNNLGKIGVKADEIYWTGLNDFLDIKGKEKVSKQDVLDFLDANAVQVKDVVLGEETERMQEVKAQILDLEDEIDILKNNYPGEPGNDIDEEDDIDDLMQAHEYKIEEKESELSILEEEMDSFEELNTPKYADSNYVVPGGKDAKELVVTIPTVEKWNESDSMHYGDIGEGRQVMWGRWHSVTSNTGDEGIIVNEFQSQRGQQGRSKGFIANKTPKKWEVYNENTGEIVATYDREDDATRHANTKDENGQYYLSWRKGTIVPPAPFITNAQNKATEAYITLLMKKAVSAAIDEGKTFVAWTTGSQQADFYDLSKSIKSIAATEPLSSGERQITLNLPNQNDESIKFFIDNNGIVKSGQFNGKPLEDIIGKDHAKSIMESDKFKLIQGDNLKIEAPWTAKMYGDENGLDAQGKPALITQAANDIARKFGGKVGSVEINDTTKTLTRSGEFRVLDENGDLWNTLRDEADALKYIASMKGKLNLHIESNVPTMRQPALIITPLMRDKILNEGMPLFSMAAPNAEDNLNEFVNKLGRTWLDNLRTDSLRSDTTEQLAKDWRTIAEHLGVPEDSFVISDEAYGKFSNDIASFFTSGDAPHAALKRVFHKIRAWMLSIYKRKPDSLSPEVRDVFNRMILIDDAVMRARAQAGYAPVFSSPEQAGMTEAEFKAYVQGTVDDRQENLDSMTEKVVKRLAKTQDQERAAAYKVIVGDIRDKLLQENVTYRILADLKEGATVGIKLGTQSIIDVGGEAALVPLKGFYKADGELDPDTLAQAYGIRSGKAMLDDMVAAKPLDERVKELADAAMSAQYGDPLNPDELTEQALTEIHSERRADILATELRILKRKKNETDKLIAPIVQDAKRQAREGRAQLSTSIPQAIIKDIAQQEISNTPVNRLRPHSYLLAETKAGREAAIAAANQQWGKAAEAKQKQILNFQFYREAVAAQKEIDVRTRRINKMLKPKARARIGLTGQDWLEQFDGLAGKQGFAPMPVDPKTQTMAQWATSVEATTGEILSLSDEALDEANKTPYKELTINEFRGVTDSLAAIHHVANKIQKVKGADHEYVLHEVAERLAQQIRDFIPRHEMPVLDSDLSTIGGFTQFGKDLIDTNLRPEKLFERMDNGKSGLFHDIFWNPAADAQFKKDDLIKKVMKPIVEFQKEHPDHGSTMKDVIDWPLMGQTITRQVAIGMALNSGNAGNKAKMQDGGIYFGDVWHPIDDNQLNQVLDQLNETDWQLVDTLWKAIAKYKEPLNDLNMRAVGLPLTMIEPTPVVTKFGTLEGGYWPAVSDPRHSKVGEMQENKSGTAIGDLYTPKFPKAATSHSFREQRTGAVYPINFDWRAVLATHVQQAALDIAYHEWIKQSDRILNKTVVKKAIQNTFGDGVYRGLQEWLVHQANPILGGYRASQAPQSLLNAAINNVAVAALGFKAATAIGNMILAPVQASHQIKSRYLISGLAQFIKNPVKLREFVDTLSGEMRHRQKNFDQTFSELTRRIAGQRGIRAEVAKLAMSIHTYADAITAPALWKAKFDQERDAGKDIKEAARLADSMLRTTQTAGAPKDLSAFERDPHLRMFKMFAGPMIIMQNEMRASVAMNGGATKAFGKPEVWATMMATWIIPSMLWELVAGRGPDDDEDWLTWAIRVVGLYPMMTMPILRDAGGALEAHFLHRKPFDKSPPIIAAAYGAVAQLGKLADSDGDVTEIAKALTRLSGFAGMPAGQMLIIEDYLDSVARDKYGPENLQYLIWRKKK